MTCASALRAAVLAVALAAASLVTTPAAGAEPAYRWTTIFSSEDDAKAQLCKEPAGNRWRVRVRLDNRQGVEGHVVGLTRNHDTSIGVRAPAGQVSGVKSLVFRTTDVLELGMGDFAGHDSGGERYLSEVGRC